MRVVLAAEVLWMRDAVAALLREDGGTELVAEAASVAELLAAARGCQAEVAVIGDVPGLAGVAELTAEVPECRSLLLTARATPAVVRAALNAGVSGLVSAQSQSGGLLRAVREVGAGGMAFDFELLEWARLEGTGPLTPREAEVLAAAAEGADAKRIARDLELSVGTVRNHLSAALRKLKAGTRVEAVKKAEQQGWIPAGRASGCTCDEARAASRRRPVVAAIETCGGS
jgi:two-component system response regulator DesR